MSDLVAIARVARPHGIRGEVTADIVTDFPERFEGLEAVTAELADSSRSELRIERFRFHQGRVMLKFAGIDTVEAAEQLRNAEICVAEADAVELEADEYFDWELEGCRVATLAGQELAARDVALALVLGPAERQLRRVPAQFIDQRTVMGGVLPERFGLPVHLR